MHQAGALAVDAGTGEILAQELTDDDTLNISMAGALVGAASGQIRSDNADVAYDGEPTYDAIRDALSTKVPPRIVIPPRAPSIPAKGVACSGSERERHALRIASVGRIAWETETDDGLRNIEETAIGRVKAMTDGRLKTRSFGAQIAESTIAVPTGNKAIRAAKPVSQRVV